MIVLEIGPYKKPKAHLVSGWDNATIKVLDAVETNNPDYLYDAEDIPDSLNEKFDGVLASHVLEHFGWWRGSSILRGWVKLLKPGGEMHIIVPSAEWAAKELMSVNCSLAVMPHLYGGHIDEYDVHKTMFTMRMLKYYFKVVGLEVVEATTGEYLIGVNNEPFTAEEHYVMGIKP